MAQDEKSEFSIVEKRDEDQILAEMQGHVIEEYFYESKGKFVISYMGVKEIARQYGNLDTELIEMRETDDAWFVVIKATDLEKGYGLLGASTQKKLTLIRDELVPDEFCFQKAFSKAQRNAMKVLLPETMFSTALEAWRANKKEGATTQPRRQAESTFNIMDYMKAKELKAPEWDIKDELNRSPESWGDAKNITETWMKETGFNLDGFKVTVNKDRIAVKANKAIPVGEMPTVSDIMISAGFTQTRNLWRLKKKDVTG